MVCLLQIEMYLSNNLIVLNKKDICFYQGILQNIRHMHTVYIEASIGF